MLNWRLNLLSVLRRRRRAKSPYWYATNGVLANGLEGSASGRLG